jgi:hypothetical protein
MNAGAKLWKASDAGFVVFRDSVPLLVKAKLLKEETQPAKSILPSKLKKKREPVAEPKNFLFSLG